MSKYHNRKSGKYASQREAKRAQELKLLEKAGEITDLKEQVPFMLIPAQFDEGRKCVERSCKYVADYTYRRRVTPRDPESPSVFVVEDAKGYRDPVYRIKRKLMLQVHGIRIREV